MADNGMTTCAYGAVLERESVPRPCHGIGIPGTTGPRWESRSSPSGWLRRCGAAMLLPLTLLGGSALGRRARRRRMVHGVIALLLAVLMSVEEAIPSLRVGLAIIENVQAISQQAFASSARAGLLAFDHRDPTSEDMGHPHAQAMLRQAVGATEEVIMTKDKVIIR